MAEPVQQNLPAIPATIGGIVTRASSKTGQALAILRSMPKRLSDDDMRQVAQIAQAEMPLLPQTDQKHLSACMARLDANLARSNKGKNDADAALKLDTQMKVFGKMPKTQLSFAVGQALVRCTFFPSIAELIEFAKEWKHPDQGVADAARNLLDIEMLQRRREHAQRLKYEIVPQDEIDTWPEWLRDGLASERLLKRDEETGIYSQDTHHADAYLSFIASQGDAA